MNASSRCEYHLVRCLGLLSLPIHRYALDLLAGAAKNVSGLLQCTGGVVHLSMRSTITCRKCGRERVVAVIHERLRYLE